MKTPSRGDKTDNEQPRPLQKKRERDPVSRVTPAQ